MSLPLGWATDVAVARLKGAEVVERADHLVVRTPDNPGYHWGNFVLVTDPASVDEAARWLTVFETELPDARHRAIGLVDVPTAAPWSASGLEIETEVVLVCDRAPHLLPLAPAYTVRELGAHDVEAQIANAMAENARLDEYDPSAHRRYLEGRALSRQRIVDAGRGAWFGAFDGETLVADLGIVDCGDGVARYQDVGTVAAHRRHGLAGHLTGVAGRWAAERGARRWVVITEADNPAGRVYRSVGFALAERPGAQAYLAPSRAAAPSANRDSEAL